MRDAYQSLKRIHPNERQIALDTHEAARLQDEADLPAFGDIPVGSYFKYPHPALNDIHRKIRVAMPGGSTREMSLDPAGFACVIPLGQPVIRTNRKGGLV